MRFTLAQAHTPPGIVRAGCLRGRGAHNNTRPHPAHKRVRLLLTEPRAPARLCRPHWAPVPPPLRAGGGWVIPRKKLQRKEQTSRKRTTRTRSPYPFPRTPYGSGEGEQTKELRQIEQTAVTGAPEPDTARLFVQNLYFVSVKTRCKQTAQTPFVYRLFCAGTPRHLARGNLSFRSK